MNKFLLPLLAILFSLHTVSAQEFVWAKELGGSSNERGYAIVTDDSGYSYTAGYFFGTVDFDPGAATYSLTSTGGADIFICKLNASGQFVWANHFGSASDDYGLGIALDDSNHVYVAGSFQGTADFDPGVGITSLISNGVTDGFVAKFYSGGNFGWAFQIGSTGPDAANAITVRSGRVFVTGAFQGTVDFDPGISASTISAAGGSDIFIGKYSLGGSYLWAGSCSGTSTEIAYAITTDPNSHIYITGGFMGSVDFDPGTGSTYLSSYIPASEDIFVCRLDSSGNFDWAVKAGANAVDRAYAIAVDDIGASYTAAYFQGIVDFDPGVPITTLTSSAGTEDQVVWKLDSNGVYRWAARTGGIYTDIPRGIAIDDSANVYMTGVFAGSVDFDPGSGTYNLSSLNNTGSPSDDIYIQKLDSTGAFRWTRKFGSIYDESGRAINIGPFGSVYSTGYFMGTTDFDPGAGVFNMTATNNDAYIQKLKQCAPDTITSSISACDNYYWNANGQTYSVSGTYTANLMSMAGCDSVMILNLIVNQSSTFTDNVTSCDSFSWPVSGQTYYTNGTYQHTLTNTAGCDSVNTLILTITQVDTSITEALPTLTANAAGATYQWIDCVADTIIPGATSQSYFVPANGTYAVVVTQNNCSDTSGCHIVNGLGSQTETNNVDILLYPNPASNSFSVHINDSDVGAEYFIFSTTGQTVAQGILTKNVNVISCDTFDAGIYFVGIGNTAYRLSLTIIH